jgi:hypothetical protein
MKNTFSYIRNDIDLLEEESLLSHGQLRDLDKVLTFIKKAERDYLNSATASNHDIQKLQSTDEPQDTYLSEQTDLTCSGSEDEISYYTNSMAPEARQMSNLTDTAPTADRYTHDNFLLDSRQPPPINNAKPHSDPEDNATQHTLETRQRPHPRETTSSTAKDNDHFPLQPKIHITTKNPSESLKNHRFNWDGQTLSIKDRPQVPEPPQPSVPKKSIPEVTIITDNPQKFVETHSLSLKDGNLLIEPSYSQSDPPATYIEIASMNTQTRNPEIPYIHLGLSAPNVIHSPVMVPGDA